MSKTIYYNYRIFLKINEQINLKMYSVECFFHKKRITNPPYAQTQTHRICCMLRRIILRLTRLLMVCPSVVSIFSVSFSQVVFSFEFYVCYQLVRFPTPPLFTTIVPSTVFII